LNDENIEENQKEEFDTDELDNIIEGLVQIKSRIGRGYIKLCPKCVTTAVREFSVTGILVPSKYYCPSCGWIGYVPLEADIDELIKHFEELVKDHDENIKRQGRNK